MNAIEERPTWSFNSKLRGELLASEIPAGLAEAACIDEEWQRHYDAEALHPSLGR